jgi:hypothetical protein
MSPENASGKRMGLTWSRFAPTLDRFLDWAYRYRGEIQKPEGVDGQVWALPSGAIPDSWSVYLPEAMHQPAGYFLHYFQSQGFGPTRNECVTTSVVMGMNLLKDRMTLDRGVSIDDLPDRRLEDYVHALDALGLRGWQYRFSTHSPLPGMMTPWQGIRALNDFIAGLKERYGRTCKVRLSAWHTVDDLLENLRQGNIILLHGAWRMSLIPGRLDFNPLLAWLGGMPHTMVLVGYDAGQDVWMILNPADPWLTDRGTPAPVALFRLTTQQLMDFWGRQFLFYPPRFAITTLVLGAL